MNVYAGYLGSYLSIFCLKSVALLFSLSFNDCKTFFAACCLFRSIQNNLFLLFKLPVKELQNEILYNLCLHRLEMNTFQTNLNNKAEMLYMFYYYNQRMYSIWGFRSALTESGVNCELLLSGQYCHVLMLYSHHI